MGIAIGVQFLLEKAPVYKDSLYHLTKAGSTVILKWSPWSLFWFLRMNFLMKGLEGVHSHKKVAKFAHLFGLRTLRPFV